MIVYVVAVKAEAVLYDSLLLPRFITLLSDIGYAGKRVDLDEKMLIPLGDLLAGLKK
jgi:hypothetical protein